MSVEHPSRHPRPLPPLAVVVSFIDCVNRRDLEGLVDLLTEDHELRILDESPLAGRAANEVAWGGYFTSYPEYVIYPERIVEADGQVVVLGTTTGSHLGLEDATERELPVIWVAEVRDGRMAGWSIVEDSLDTRHRLGLI